MSGVPPALATFGDRLRTRRLDLGLTRAELADLINATPAAIYGWEVGRTHPHHGAYSRLAEALQTTIDYLMAGHAR